MKKKGFTLIELLAVILILGIIALIAIPTVTYLVKEAKRKAYLTSTNGLIKAAENYYAESLLNETKKGSLDGKTNLINEVEIKGKRPNNGELYIDSEGNVGIAVIYDGVCYKKSFDASEIIESEDIDNCSLFYVEYVLNGAYPKLSEGMIPVIIESDGTVKKASLNYEWYKYEEKRWANAVILKDNAIEYEDNEEILESNIDSYFVWIPRYKYKLFNLGEYSSATTVSSKPTTSTEQRIEIVFENKNTPVSTGNEVGSYLTHPAFTSFDVNGLWVAKFETSGSSSDMDVLPNKTSLREINIKTMFELAYNYDRTLDSHMMKNTEWGAVAYLTNSEYGRCEENEDGSYTCEEVRINNASTYTTGCAATVAAENYVNKSQTDHSEGYYAGCENAYNTSIGHLASTTGNITGIYDMSGGTWEYMASYISGIYGSSGFNATNIAVYDPKYFDIYSSGSTATSYNNRILGDATGELGPFYYYKDSDGALRRHNTWNSDLSTFVDSTYSWFDRGNRYLGVLAGVFAHSQGNGVASDNETFRVVLAN